MQVCSAGCSYLVSLPPITIKESKSCLAITISAIAIVILSVLSLGYYAYYTYKILQGLTLENNVIALQKKLSDAVMNDKFDEVRKILKKYPSLIKMPEMDTFRSTGRKIPQLSALLPFLAEKKKIEMIKLLCDLDVSPNFPEARKTVLKVAVGDDNLDLVKYLIEKKVTVEKKDLTDYFMTNQTINFDIAIALLNKLEEVDSKSSRWSLLAMAAGNYDSNPAKCKEMIDLLIKKGDRLKEKDLEISNPEALQHIKAALVKKSNH